MLGNSIDKAMCFLVCTKITNIHYYAGPFKSRWAVLRSSLTAVNTYTVVTLEDSDIEIRDT